MNFQQIFPKIPLNISTQIQIQLNKVVIQRNQVPLRKNLSKQQFSSAIFEKYGIACMQNISSLTMKFFSSQLEIENIREIDNVLSLKNFSLCHEDNDRVIMIGVGPKDNNNQRIIVVYEGERRGQIQQRSKSKLKDPHEILKISQPHYLRSKQMIFWIITTQNGKLYLLSSCYEGSMWSSSITDISQTSKVQNIWKSFIKPFLPVKHPYSQCFIFLQSQAQNSDLYIFTLFDFSLQVRFLNLNDRSCTSLWEQNLANILPRETKFIIYAKMKKIHANIASFILICYQQDRYNDDNQIKKGITIYFLQIEINSNSPKKTHQKTLIKNIIPDNDFNCNLSVEITEQKLWMLYLDKKKRMYTLIKIDLMTNGLQDLVNLAQFGDEQLGMLIKLKQLGVCLLFQSKIFKLELTNSDIDVSSNYHKAKNYMEQAFQNDNEFNFNGSSLLRNSNFDELLEELQNSKKKFYQQFDENTIQRMINVQILMSCMEINGFKQLLEIQYQYKPLQDGQDIEYYNNQELQQKKLQKEDDLFEKLFGKNQTKQIFDLFQRLEKADYIDRKQYFHLFQNRIQEIIRKIFGIKQQNEEGDMQIEENQPKTRKRQLPISIQQLLYHHYLPLYLRILNKNTTQQHKKIETLKCYNKFCGYLDLYNPKSHYKREENPYIQLETMSPIYKTFSNQTLRNLCLETRNPTIFQYLFKKNAVNQEMFENFVKRYMGGGKEEELIEIVKQCVNYQIQKRMQMSCLIWSLKYSGFYQPMAIYLQQRAPQLLLLYSLAAQAFNLSLLTEQSMGIADPEAQKLINMAILNIQQVQ